jgi:hypothetical protein
MARIGWLATISTPSTTSVRAQSNQSRTMRHPTTVNASRVRLFAARIRLSRSMVMSLVKREMTDPTGSRSMRSKSAVISRSNMAI